MVGGNYSRRLVREGSGLSGLSQIGNLLEAFFGSVDPLGKRGNPHGGAEMAWREQRCVCLPQACTNQLDTRRDKNASETKKHWKLILFFIYYKQHTCKLDLTRSGLAGPLGLSPDPAGRKLQLEKASLFPRPVSQGPQILVVTNSHLSLSLSLSVSLFGVFFFGLVQRHNNELLATFEFYARDGGWLGYDISI